MRLYLIVWGSLYARFDCVARCICIYFCSGCKIKALRAKTNTYIKTPVRGEEPIFAISGRPEHVASAKREILDFVDHLSELRAARSGLEEKVMIHVWVPYHVVGLVVGPKGATVKRIQQVTQTYIVTPSRDKDPFFEVKGTSANVARARKEIESYIALRTNLESSDDLSNRNSKGISGHAEENLYSHFHKSHLPKRREPFLAELPASRSTSSVFQFPGFRSALNNLSDSCEYVSTNRIPTSRPSTVFDFSGRGRALSNDVHPLLLEGSSGDITNPITSSMSATDEYRYGWKPTVFSGMRFTPPSTSYQPMSAHLLTPEHSNSLRSISQPISPTGSWESSSSDGVSTVSPKLSPSLIKQQSAAANPKTCYCCMVAEDEEMAALIPCRHNFCQKCAHYISCTLGSCPLCNTQVTNVMHL